MFGPLEFGPDGRVTAEWQRRNMALVTLPYPLVYEFSPSGATIKRLYCHRMVAERFLMAFEAIRESGLSSRARHYAGCWNVRFIAGTRRLSLHSWGIAIDLNARKNPVGAEPRQDMRVVEIFRDGGFTWGGDFSRRDGMHFQWAGPRA